MRPMMGVFSVLLAMALITKAALAAPSCEPEKLASKYPGLIGKTIRIGQDGQSPPFSFRDPKDVSHIIGFDADLARAVFACIGLPVNFVIGSWSGLVPGVAAGRIDVMWDGLYYTKERAKIVDYVLYTMVADAVLVRKGNPTGVKSLHDLCGLRAVASLGSVEQVILNDTAETCVKEGKPKVTVFTAQDHESEWGLIASGRADLGLTTAVLADAVAAKDPGTFERGFSFLSGITVGAGVAKGNTELERAIFDALGVLHANGAILKIYDDYQIPRSLNIPPKIMTD